MLNRLKSQWYNQITMHLRRFSAENCKKTFMQLYCFDTYIYI